MGMYDYLGVEQVKCFTVPIAHVSCHTAELTDAKVVFGASGGRLKHYAIGDEVPYQSKFYNYGRNFIVFDYRTFNGGEIPMLHVICDGRYVASYSSDNIPEDLEISMVVDKYGAPLNINKLSDFAACAIEDIEADVLYDKLLEEKCKEFGVSVRFPSRDEFLSMGQDAMSEYFKKRQEAQNIACENSFDLFRNRWFLPNATHDPTMIGCILSIREERRDPEWCWYQIVSEYIKMANETYGGFENALDKYISWATKNDILVNANEIRYLFYRYSKSIPQEVVDEYLQTETYNNMVSSYQILHKSNTNA